MLSLHQGILTDGHREVKACAVNDSLLEKAPQAKVTSDRRWNLREKYAFDLQDISHIAYKMNPSKYKLFFSPIISGVLKLILFVATRNFCLDVHLFEKEQEKDTMMFSILHV